MAADHNAEFPGPSQDGTVPQASAGGEGTLTGRSPPQDRTTVESLRGVLGGYPPPGQELRYQVVRPLARGGLGEIFVALDRELHREVALKEILAHHALDDGSRARFVQEAEITGGLEHPGVVPVYGLGAYVDGRPYYAMRLIRGETLKEALRRFHAGEPGATLRGLLTRFVSVCNAVAYAHSRGVLHRDLKPSNIMLGKYGETLVVDWGLAKAVGRPDVVADAGETTLLPHSSDVLVVTQLGAAVGTPAFMSPEQAEGRLEQLGPSSDVYSLGATLYVILTGRPPVQGADTPDVLTRVRAGNWPPPRAVQPEVAPALQAICLKAMALRPDERYGTALELAADIERWLADEPVTAWREPWSVQARRWVSRRRTLVASAAAALLVGVVVAVVGLVLLAGANQRETEARGIAEDQRDEARRNLYASRMKEIQQAWEIPDVGHVRELLDSQRPASTGEKDLRGWEWYYQDRLGQGDLRTLAGHSNRVTRVVFSPDGRTLASAGQDGLIKIWDVATGQLVRELDGLCRPVNDLAFSPDGQSLASAGADGTLRRWDAATGTLLHTFEGHQGYVQSVVFSPDGRTLASAGHDRTVRLWDLVTGQPREPLQGAGHTEEALDVAFSPDGRTLASTGYDGMAKLWDVASGRLRQDLDGLGGPVYCLTFSPTGDRLLTGGTDGFVRVWDLAAGRELPARRRYPGHVHSIAYSPDGRTFAACGVDQTVRVWNAAGGDEPLTFKGHTNWLYTVAYSPDGLRLASGGQEGTIKLWDAGSGRGTRSVGGPGERASDVTFSPDGTLLATAGHGSAVRLWEAANGRLIRTDAWEGGRALSLAFSRDGRLLAAGGEDHLVHVMETAGGREALRLTGHAGPVQRVAWSPSGESLASSDFEGTVKVWAVGSGHCLETFKDGDAKISGLAFSQDSRLLFTAGKNQRIRVYELGTGRPPRTFADDQWEIHVLVLSPDGTRLASGGNDQRVCLWDIASGRRVLTLKGHTGSVRGIAFNPDGTRLVSASNDGTLKIWDTGNGQELRTLRGSSIGLTGVAFGPDGWRLAWVAKDGIVKVADAGPATTEVRDEVEAMALVEGLLARPLASAQLANRLRAFTGISEDVRRRALELAAGIPEDPFRFHAAAWDVVRYPYAPPDLTRRALTWTTAAVRLDPDNGKARTVLGVAQHRNGNHAAAVTTLEKALEINRGKEPADLAFLAMARHRLGRKAEAQAALDDLRDALKHSGIADIKEAQTLLEEAEMQLRDPAQR